MSKAYMNDKQVQQHAGDPKPPTRLLPGIGAPPVPELPAETPDLFTSEDVAQAALAHDTALRTYMGRGMKHADAHCAAIREVMMLALALAAVNLDVHPGS